MIIGIGVDMADTRRIDSSFNKFKEVFLNRIFTKSEIEFCLKRKRYIESFTKMFSIKEAILKAISNTSGIFWKDMEIFHDENGKPFVKLYNKALKNIEAKTKGKPFNVEVSVSDEIPYVCAFVVIETV